MSTVDQAGLPYLQPTRRRFITTAALGVGASLTGKPTAEAVPARTILYCKSEYEHFLQKGERFLFMEARLARLRADFWELVDGGGTWFELRCSQPEWFKRIYRSAWERDHWGLDLLTARRPGQGDDPWQCSERGSRREQRTA